MISVIIPVYNVEEYLLECLNSVYSQTYDEYEVIAINDGSTDHSLEILYQFRKTHKEMIILSQNNCGLGATRNMGLSIARGEYVYFLDADDTIEPNLLEVCAGILESQNCEIVGFQASVFGEISNKNINQYMYCNRCDDMNTVINGIDFFAKYHRTIKILNTPLLFFSKSFLLNNGLFFMENVLHEDVEFYYRMISKEPRLLMIDSVLYHRRYRQLSIMTSAINGKRLYDIIKVYKRISTIYVNEYLEQIYLYDVFKEIRKSLHILTINKISHNEEEDTKLLYFYRMMCSKIDKMDFMSRNYFIMGYYYLVNNKRNIDSAIFSILQNDIEYLCNKTGLYNESQNVGIYGTGETTDVFLDTCALIKGFYPNNVVYIDTYAETNSKKYRDVCIRNYRDVDFNIMKCVIISSELYEKEIRDRLTEQNATIPVYGITTDLIPRDVKYD